MGPALALLNQRSQEGWQFGAGRPSFCDRAWKYYRQIKCFSRSPQPPHLFLADADPENFLAGFIAACAANCPVTIGNPQWTQTEQNQAIALVQPSAILTQEEIQPQSQPGINLANPSYGSKDISPQKVKMCHAPRGTSSAPKSLLLKDCSKDFRNLDPAQNAAPILIPTGGSSGRLRFAHHTWNTLIASVKGFQQHFQCDPINCLCILPVHHVSGLMQFMRAFVSGGQLWVKTSADFFRNLSTLYLQSGRELAGLNPAETFISLVPTQLQRMLDQHPLAIPWLARFQAVLLGGAPAWTTLLNQAQATQLPIALTYGMTETASQVATLRPAEFLAGDRSCGQALPHAAIEIWDDRDQPLPPNQPGQIVVWAKSQALGYISPQPDNPLLERHTKNLPPLRTADWGWLDDRGYLHIGGRWDRAILTGGETVFPEEIEAAIQTTKLVQDVCVVGLPDAQWGERVVAAYVPLANISETQISQAIAAKLAGFKRPKQWVALSALPRNAQGKLNLDQLKRYCGG